MSLRHLPRQPDRDVRMHEPSAPHPHNIINHPHPQGHPPHLNGSTAVPTTPGALSNGSAHAHTTSPAVVSTTVPNGTIPTPTSTIHKLAVANEQTWLLMGSSLLSNSLVLKKISYRIGYIFPGRIAEQMGDLEHAQSAYENALRHNPLSLSGLTQVAGIARIKENYPMVSMNLLHV
jgi:general transcriptional corepressor CYC8